MQGRYSIASKKEKGQILDEFTKVTGYHLKAAIRLFHRGKLSRTKRKRGYHRRYGSIIAEALRVAWEATDCLCYGCLHPFLPEVVKIVRGHGERIITAEIEADLWRISPSIIDWLLHLCRRFGGHCPFATTRQGSLLKSAMPIKTFADCQDDCPGFLDVDLVSHCGESAEGFYLTALSTVDVASE